MQKIIISILLIFLSQLQIHAFEDCIVTSKGKLTDISVEDNKILDVYPLITIGNDKNTLFVHPLQTGKTRFCVLKNNKDIVMFNVKITENKTIIDSVSGFDILPIDIPPGVFELDAPPTFVEEK